MENPALPEPANARADSPVLPEPTDTSADSRELPDAGADSPMLPGPPNAGADGPVSAGPSETTIELPVMPVTAETAVGSPVPAGTADTGADSPVPAGPADGGAESPVPPGPNEMTMEVPADTGADSPVLPGPADTSADGPVPLGPNEMTMEVPAAPLPAETAVGNTVPPAPADAGLDRAAPSADTGRGRPVLPGAAETANSRGLTALAVTAGLVVAAVGLAQTSPGHSLLREVGLYAEPATYTALAFTNPQSLPSHLSAAPAQVAVSFAVSNVSPDPHSYSWSIVLKAAGQTSRVAAGEVGVPAHGHATVTRTVTASCPGGQAVMTVRLAAPAESIDFQAACSS